MTFFFFFFFNDTATTEIYTLSLHDALPISAMARVLDFMIVLPFAAVAREKAHARGRGLRRGVGYLRSSRGPGSGDRKSTRLNSSHDQISYAVFCLKKKKR